MLLDKEEIQTDLECVQGFFDRAFGKFVQEKLGKVQK